MPRHRCRLVGTGAGIYKMASSLRAALGIAISAAIFPALSANPDSISWMEGVITFAGRQDNLAVREAAIIALMFNGFMVLAAILSIIANGQPEEGVNSRESSPDRLPRQLQFQELKSSGDMYITV